MANREYAQVKEVKETDYNGKVYYAIVLDNNNTYKTGATKPPVNPGDKVAFTYEQTQYGNKVNLNTLKVYNQRRQESSGNQVQTKDSYWENKANDDIKKGRQISYQAAVNTAIEMVNFGVSNGFIKLGAKATWDAYKTVVYEHANDLYQRYQNIYNTNTADTPTAYEKYQQESLPDSDDDVAF